jgi:cellulose synthase/poly-beta-1,6-N-acetylglucosamine synthase-like glycosyltransferase
MALAYLSEQSTTQTTGCPSSEPSKSRAVTTASEYLSQRTRWNAFSMRSTYSIRLFSLSKRELLIRNQRLLPHKTLVSSRFYLSVASHR